MKRTIENVSKLIEEGYSTRQLAKVFGITQSPMYTWLRKNGLETKLKHKKTVKTWSDDQLIAAVKKCDTKIDVIRELGLSERPGNYDTINRAINRLGIDISHFIGQAHTKSGHRFEDHEVFIKDSTYARKGIKKRIIDGELFEYSCTICGISEWNNNKLILILDHINGINNDHRIKNLRFLCPNCNSQQDTFCRGSSVVVAED